MARIVGKLRLNRHLISVSIHYIKRCLEEKQQETINKHELTHATRGTEYRSATVAHFDCSTLESCQRWFAVFKKGEAKVILNRLRSLADWQGTVTGSKFEYNGF